MISHSWSTTPTQIPALWLAATSCNLAEKMNMFICGRSHIAVGSQSQSQLWTPSHRTMLLVAVTSHRNCEQRLTVLSPPGRLLEAGPHAICSAFVSYLFIYFYSCGDANWCHHNAGIYVRPWTGPQTPPLWWPAVAKLQAASMPVA